MQLCKQGGISGGKRIRTKILKSESSAWNLTLRKVGDSGALRDKYVEITAHILLGDAGKLSFNFLSALDFSILFRKTSELQGTTRG
jgi:hypothetical protein